MSKKNVHSFAAGEVSPTLKGRPDFARYFQACLTLINYLVKVTGAAFRRTGTRFVNETKDSTTASRLIEFVFSRDIAYILEFGNEYIRFYRDGAVLGLPYEISSPYLSSNLHLIKTLSVGDLVYLADGINRPRKLIRSGDTSWSLSELEFKNGPFREANLDETLTITPSYPAWATATAYTKNQIVTPASPTAVNPPSYTSGNLDNLNAVNVGGGLVDIPSTGHGLTAGMGVTLALTTAYDGDYIVQSGTTVNLIRITATFTAELFAGTETFLRKSIPVDKGAGLVGIPTDTNAFASGAVVTLAGFVAYNGIFTLHPSSTTTEAVIATTYTAEYFDGTETVTESQFYKALTDHTSGAGNPTPPGNTTDWTPALTFTGSNITLTASSALFESGHVGALFKISHPRTDNSISGALTAIGESQWLRVSKDVNWTLTTSGTWGGVLELRRSYTDGATFGVVKTFRSEGLTAARNVVSSGTELDEGALYQVALTEYVNGTFNYDFNIDEFDTEGIIEITGYTSSTVVTGTVKSVLGNVLTTFDWCEGSFSDFRGWPNSLAFYDRRIVYGGNAAEPTRVHFSNSDDFENFQRGSLADQSFSVLLEGDEINSIQWLEGMEDLIVATARAIWRIGANDRAEPLSPTNNTVRWQSNDGSDIYAPVKSEGRLIYTGFRGKRVYQLAFDGDSNRYVSTDLNELADHLFEDSAAAECIAVDEPEKIIYVRRKDGVLCALTLRPGQQVFAWSRIITGNSGECESVAQIPGSTENEIWCVYKRTVNGVVKRYVEKRQDQQINRSDLTAHWYLDSALEFKGLESIAITGVTNANPCVVTAPGHGLATGNRVEIRDVTGMTELEIDVWYVVVLTADTFSIRLSGGVGDIDSTSWSAYVSGGVATQVAKTVSGLSHLEGQSVEALCDGNAETGLTVSGGQVTVTNWCNRIIVGIAYDQTIEPMPPDFPNGAFMGEPTAADALIIGIIDTPALQVKLNWSKTEHVNLLDQSQTMDSAYPLKSGSFFHGLEVRYGRNDTVIIKQILPLPQTVISLSYDLESAGLRNG